MHKNLSAFTIALILLACLTVVLAALQSSTREQVGSQYITDVRGQCYFRDGGKINEAEADVLSAITTNWVNIYQGNIKSLPKNSQQEQLAQQFAQARKSNQPLPAKQLEQYLEDQAQQLKRDGNKRLADTINPKAANPFMVSNVANCVLTSVKERNINQLELLIKDPGAWLKENQ